MIRKFFCILILLFSLVEISYAVEKIIPMAPNLVETVYALGQGDKVCAVPMFTTYPEEALKKESAGSYLSPSFETILRLSPDLIIIQGKFEKLTKFAGLHGIDILSVNMDSTDSIYKGILSLGKKLNCEESALSLVNSIKRRLTLNSARKQPTVFVCLGRIPGTLKQIYTCGGKSFISELVEAAGGKNIFSQIDKNYLSISKEEILKRDPDFIIDVLPGIDISADKEDKIKNLWRKIGPVKAVKSDNIHVLNDDFILIPGPRIVKTAELFRRIFKGN